MTPERALGSFAAAVLRLHLQSLTARNIPAQDVEVALCEDGETVSLIAPDGSGGWLTASFMLREKVEEDLFDANFLSDLLNAA